MKIVNFRVFKGRNIYYHKKCIRINIDTIRDSEIYIKDIYDFNKNLIDMFPGFSKHICSEEVANDIIKNCTEGTYFVHIMEHIIIEIHNKIGVELPYVRYIENSSDNYYIIYQYEYINTGLEAANIAVDIVNSLVKKEPFHLDLRLDRLKGILLNEQWEISTMNICNEAEKKGIPILKIGANSMFQLGYGKYSKIIQGTMDSNTNIIAVNITQDKLLTKEILNSHCLPAPRCMKVGSKIDSFLIAKDIGYPVVIKPQFSNQGKVVIANIKNEKQLSEAYEFLIKNYNDIIIEKHINGRDYRICCVYGEIIAVSERIPPHSTLAEKENIYLKDKSNLSTRRSSIDCTDLICEENIKICKRAASAIGLDICSIDVRCVDIRESLNEDGAIIAVNTTPDITMHHNPTYGATRNVAGHIVDKLFKDIPNKFPLISVTGTNGKTTTTRLIAHILTIAGYTVGMTTTGGIYIDGKCIYKGDTTGPKSALTVLMNKNIDAAVLETARGGILREGLAYDLADVAVITNITEDHLGLDGVETMEDLAKVKALVGEAVKEEGYVVINGDNNMSVSILHRLRGNIIIFSNDKDNEVMQNNIKNGGYGVYVDDGYIIIQKAARYEKLIDIKSIGITIKGILKYNIENAMAACGAAIGLGINYDIIRQGLGSFYSNSDQNPGRFNMYFINNVMIILDYGHNIDGYKRVLDGLKHIKHNKLIGVIGVPGDRPDSHILDLGKCAGDNFDYIFIKENKDGRGRAIGEVADLLEKGVLRSKFQSMNIKKVLKEQEAFKMALDISKPGDIVIIFFEKLDPLIEIIGRKDEEIKYQAMLSLKR